MLACFWFLALLTNLFMPIILGTIVEQQLGGVSPLHEPFFLLFNFEGLLLMVLFGYIVLLAFIKFLGVIGYEEVGN